MDPRGRCFNRTGKSMRGNRVQLDLMWLDVEDMKKCQFAASTMNQLLLPPILNWFQIIGNNNARVRDHYYNASNTISARTHASLTVVKSCCALLSFLKRRWNSLCKDCADTSRSNLILLTFRCANYLDSAEGGGDVRCTLMICLRYNLIGL